MAIVFTKQKKKQDFLTLVFLFAVIIAFLLLWQGFFREETLPPREISLEPAREIEIDFEVFEKLEKLEPFLEIERFEEISPTEDDPTERKIGRENPFLPY